MQDKNTKKSETKKNLVYTFVTCLIVAMVALVIVLTNPATGDLDPHDPVDGDGITFLMPVENGEVIKEFSNTALKWNATLKQWESHKAVDIKTTAGADVVSVLDGKVLKIENTYLLGKMVTIEHADGLKTIYANLGPTLIVEEGQMVKKGEKIGIVGVTAKGEINDGPHLHFEVYKNGVKTNANLYLDFTDVK